MDVFTDSKDIFHQLADIDGSAGVQSIIENHDAWSHNAHIQSQISAALRAQLARTPRPESVSRRIAHQRQSLSSLVTLLPHRLPIAS